MTLSRVEEVQFGLIILVTGVLVILLVAQAVAWLLKKTWLVDHLRMMILVLLGFTALGFGIYLILSALVLLLS